MNLTFSQMQEQLDKAEGRGRHQQSSGEASSSQPGAYRFVGPTTAAYDSPAGGSRKRSQKHAQSEPARQSIHHGVEPSTKTVHFGYANEDTAALEDRLKVLEAALRRKESDNERLSRDYESSVADNIRLQEENEIHVKEKQTQSDPNAASGGGTLLGGRGRNGDAERRDEFEDQWEDDEYDLTYLTNEFSMRRGISAFSTSRKIGMVKKMRGKVHVTAEMLAQYQAVATATARWHRSPRTSPRQTPSARMRTRNSR